MLSNLMNNLFEVGKCYKIIYFWLYDYNKETKHIKNLHEQIIKNINVLVLDIDDIRENVKIFKILMNGKIYWIHTNGSSTRDVQRISND